MCWLEIKFNQKHSTNPYYMDYSLAVFSYGVIKKFNHFLKEISYIEKF